MSRLNPIEQEAQDVLVVVRDILTATKGTPREAYTELMGRIRDVLEKLQNKEYGCPSGRHAGNCSCAKEGDRGHSLPAR